MRPTTALVHPYIGAMRQNLRLAFRSLNRARGFSVTAILTLALGIGLATAVFTVADAFLIRPLPVREQSRLVVLWTAMRNGSFDNYPLGLEDARAFARRTRTLEDVAFFGRWGAGPVPIREGGKIIRIRMSLVSGGFFDVLGARPILGRGLRPADDVKGAQPVVVLSYGAWQRWFGGDSGVVGRRIVMHETGKSLPVIGVMPQGLDYPRGVDGWSAVIPGSGPLGDEPIYTELDLIGRMRAGVTPAAARADLDAYLARSDARPKDRELKAVVHTFSNAVLGDTQPAVIALGAAAALLLVIMCINVAVLLLVRGLARAREMALRTALGASRGALVRQLMLESTLLACVGGLLGLLLAAVAVPAFLRFAPAGLPRLDEIHLSGAFVGIALGVTALVMIVFSLPPAVVTSGVHAREALRAGTRGSGMSRRLRIGTETLVAGQLALAVIVLAAAGVIGRSLMQLERLDLALDPSHLLVAELALPFEQEIGKTSKELDLIDRLMPRLAATPGVVSATPVLIHPFSGQTAYDGQMVAEGQTPEEGRRNPMLNIEVIAPNYFTTLGIPVERGRAFGDGDVKGAPPVAILSASAARHYWPGADPIGRHLSMDRTVVTVVGIVPDTRYRDLREPRPSVYFPLRQNLFPVAPTTLIVRSRGSSAAIVPAVRQVVHDVDANVGVASALPFDELLDMSRAQPRLNALLLATFAAAALLLAGVGLYGAMATMVRQRTREMGVRMALGAQGGDLSRLVLGRGMWVAGLGLGVGLVAALATNRLVGSMLFQVTPTDPRALALASGILVVTAGLASLVPARWSTRVDPLIALRTDE